MPNSSPPHTGDGIALAHGVLQPFRHPLQQQVPEALPQRVVDGLEAVQVQEHQRHHPLVALRPRKRLREAVLEEGPVRQARQVIVLGQVGEVLLGPFALDSIADGPRYQVAVPLALDQVVLRPALQGIERRLLVVEPAQHHHRHVGSRVPNPCYGLQPLRVGEREIQQDDVEVLLKEKIFRLIEPIDV